MQRTAVAAAAALAILVGATLAPQRAEAMPVGRAAAVTATPLAQNAAYVCHLAWRCGRYGCGWRRVCYRTAPRRYWAPRYYYRHHRYRW